MSVLIDHDGLGRRRRAAAGPLKPLAESLASDLEPLLNRELYFPSEKALLSRAGGRCEVDGTMLDFDPFSRQEHRCPRCGRVYTGELHERFWNYWYQLWLAERAVHGAALSSVGLGDRYATLAHGILAGYCDRYLRYPNVDNVLGPTRLFFSTYLESIWLLQICVAADLMASRESALVERVRAEIVEPSRSLIAEFDEGGSNRQVWNEVALLAAARLLGDTVSAERAALGRSGVARQIAHGILSDGTWYEGENYHLFAHRGLWYGVTMAEHAGIEIEPALVQRFQRGFSVPLLSALPDFTLPSRRDSQYGISLRQWRIAEHCELGLAREDDPTLRGALARMYLDDVPGGPLHRDRSAGDVERNSPASALTRADLSWRALLFALPELPSLDAIVPASALLEGQGLAVFRRDEGRAYAALDYGHSGGGHGHPDRLNLVLVHDAVRWLDDFGTGSYVDRTLHWYRSTLAHNAPLVDGRSQRATNGTLAAYDEREDCGWVSAEAEIAPGVRARRSIVVLSTYLVDRLEWDGNEATPPPQSPDVGEAEPLLMFDLPLHAALELTDGVGEAVLAPMPGAHGLEDGFDFAHDTSLQQAGAGATVVGRAMRDGGRASLWARSTAACEWWRASALGAPGLGDHVFRLVRAREVEGRHEFVWSWSDAVVGVEFGESLRVSLAGGAVHEHHPAMDRWEIVFTQADGETRGVTLTGVARRTEAPASDAAPLAARPPLRLLRDGETKVALGAEHYRRSEQTWSAAGCPTADLSFRARGSILGITVTVPRSDVTFAARDADNPLDNESADVNGDGIQLYARLAGSVAAWMLVPELGGDHVRVRGITGKGTTSAPPHAVWERVGDGYRVNIDLDAGELSAIDLIVNEMPRGRHRRRGQLVLSGGNGEFVYLRGDRQDDDRLAPIQWEGEGPDD
jgi:Heparinase II/III-like protein